MHAFFTTVISFVFVLGVLVSVHELGHYLAARWRGVHVDIFSIGFGKPLYSWHDRVGTEWRICPIPLGGYVKPHGFEDPEDATEEQKAAWISGKTFHEKPVLDRMIVIVAGPLFNFILAIVLFAGLFVICGKPVTQPLIGQVFPNSAASRAGLQSMDFILKLDQISDPTVPSIIQFSQSHPGFTAQITVKRNEKVMTLPITIAPAEQQGKTVGKLGVGLDARMIWGERLSVGSSLVTAFKMTWDITVQTLDGLGQLITGRASVKELGGPIRIAQVSGKVASKGFGDLVFLMGVLSINLGLINLFPIPLLDGGRLLFYTIEAVCHRPLSRRIQALGMQAGLVLILLLFLFVTYNDISQLKWPSWLTGHSK